VTKDDVLQPLFPTYPSVVLIELAQALVYKRKWMEDGKEHIVPEHDAMLGK
jgi:hypothetical protein